MRNGLLRVYPRVRRRLRLPVALLDRRDLRRCGIEGAGSLRSRIAGEVDRYKLTHRLLRLALSGGLRIFDRTAALRYRHSGSNVSVDTDRGPKIRCGSVFFATGYETRDILSEKVVTLKSTYALVSEPIADLGWWKDRSLVWGTGDPCYTCAPPATIAFWLAARTIGF